MLLNNSTYVYVCELGAWKTRLFSHLMRTCTKRVKSYNSSAYLKTQWNNYLHQQWADFQNQNSKILTQIVFDKTQLIFYHKQLYWKLKWKQTSIKNKHYEVKKAS